MSKHFSDQEMMCRCGCGGLIINEKLYEVLERMRELCKCPLIINSAYRCPKHNARVGGVPNSFHVYGIAADVALPEGFIVEDLASIAEQAGADGIGLYDWGVHVDVRGYKARWDYRYGY